MVNAMGEVITYANNDHMCFCQIKLQNGERILISIASAPTPSIKIVKLGLLGLLPKQTIWEYNPTMAGGYDAYVRKTAKMFLPIFSEDGKNTKSNSIHPLDVLRDLLLPCYSVSEARDLLLEAEHKVTAQE